ncbi:MAG TPA: hypothetical protein VMV18_01030 [bacterium]|nr:hypothetical protein [bacterium]
MRAIRSLAVVPAALVFAATALLGQQPAKPHVPCNDGTIDSTGHKSPCGKHNGVKPQPRGAVVVNTPGGAPAQVGAAPAPAGTAHPAPTAAPSSATKLVPPASAPVVIPPSPNAPPAKGGIGTSTTEVKFAPPPNTKVYAPPPSSGGGIGGNTVEEKDRSPRDATVSTKAAGATAKCKDGTYSHTTDTKIMCGGHSGVGQKLGETTSN